MWRAGRDRVVYGGGVLRVKSLASPWRGPRIGIGDGFAWMEAMPILVLATLGRQWTMCPTPRSPD